MTYSSAYRSAYRGAYRSVYNYGRSSVPGPAIDPIADLFVNGSAGAVYLADTSHLYTDSTKNTLADAQGDLIRVISASYGPGADATTANDATSPYLDIGASGNTLVFDTVDDTIVIPAGFDGYLVVGTASGIYSGRASFDSTFEFGNAYNPSWPITGIMLIDRELSDKELEQVRSVLVSAGAKRDFGDVTSFAYAWLNSPLVTFDFIDTSQGTNFYQAWYGCSSLTSFPQLDTSQGTSFYQAWRGCTGLTAFPQLDTSQGTSFYQAWYGCSSLTSFPQLDTSQSTSFYHAWRDCTGLTSFPKLDTSQSTDFTRAWYGCSSLTSFPQLDTSQSTKFYLAWYGCSGLTSFPQLDTSQSTSFYQAWYGCSGLTSFSKLDTSQSTDFYQAWYGCSGLTSFPQLDTSQSTSFQYAWEGCSSLTSFPQLDTSQSTSFYRAWYGCSGLVSFPPNMFDNSTSTSYDLAFQNCALNEESVDGILVSINTAGQSNGTLDIDVGTSATPSASGKAAADALRARGWAVTLNGY